MNLQNRRNKTLSDFENFQLEKEIKWEETCRRMKKESRGIISQLDNHLFHFELEIIRVRRCEINKS